MTQLLQVAALVSLGLVAYSYVVYPAIVWLVSRVRPTTKPPSTTEPLPTVSLLIAAHNEEECIAERLRNALQLDYDRDRLEIVVASDGSTDRTNDIVRSFAADGVRLLEFSPNRGKSAALNAALPELSGEVVVFSDANTMYEADAIRRIVRWFSDERIGVVCGKLVLTDSRTGRNADGLYWRYENFLKRCEARLGALLGANGAIYAMRRSQYVPIPDNTIIDDFMIPLSAQLRHGCRAVYDGEARAHEDTAASIGHEFHRRARIGTGAYQSLATLWPVLAPWRGWLAFAFASHKVLRWIAPLLLFIGFVSSLLLRSEPFFRGLLIAQVAFYGLAVVGAFLPGRRLPVKLLRVGSLFCGMNAALAVGFWRWAFVPQNGTWKRTGRDTGGAS